MAATAKDRFDAAVNVIHSLPKDGPFQPSYEMMLSFYGYYKQATEGQCTKPKPWAWDIVAKKKWDAWTKLGDMPRERAMERYVEELTKNIKSCSAKLDEMRQNGDSRIVEAMPQNQVVREFMEKLGNFYEIVEEKLPGREELQKHNQAMREDQGPSGSSGSSPDISSSDISEQGHEDEMDHSMMVESILRVEGSEDVLQNLMRSEELASKIKNEMDTLESALQAENSQLDETTKLTNGLHVNGDKIDSESDEEFCDTSDQPSQEEVEDSPERVEHSVSTPLKSANSRVGNHVHFNSSLMIQTDAEIHKSTMSPISKFDANDNVAMTPDFKRGRHEDQLRRVHFTDSLLVHAPSEDSLDASIDSVNENLLSHSQSLLSDSSPPHVIGQTDSVQTRGGGDSPPSGRSRSRAPPRDHGLQEPSGSRTGYMYGAAGGTGGNLPSGSGGRGQENPPPFPPSQGGVNEQIAVALIRLQQDMNNVLTRLHNLETAARQRATQEKQDVRKKNVWMSRWWPFPSLRGRTFFFVLVWPIIVHWLLVKMFYRRRQRR